MKPAIEQVALVYRPSEREHYKKVMLIIHYTDNTTQEILVVECDTRTSGYTLEKWKRVTHKGHDAIGVFLWISAMGHELDQWAYYHLETGEYIK